MDLESCLHQTLGLARPQEAEGKVARSGAGVGTAQRSDGGKGAFDTTGAEDRFLDPIGSLDFTLLTVGV